MYGCPKDLRRIVKRAQARFPKSRIYGVAYSMGANILVNYLGKYAEKGTGMVSAVSIGQGYDIEKCMNYVGTESWYMWIVTNKMKQQVLRNRDMFEGKVDFEKLERVKTLKEFDMHFSCRVYGFSTPEEYWREHSSIHSIKHTKIPLLLVNAADDPLVCRSVLRTIRNVHREKNNIIAVICSNGGHLGFVEGKGLGILHDWGAWMDHVAYEFVDASQELL